MDDTELIRWARKYFGAIPNKYRLPSDRSLAMQVALVDVLTQEQRNELSWIRTLVEGNIITKEDFDA
jgi:hypothetical protein